MRLEGRPGFEKLPSIIISKTEDNMTSLVVSTSFGSVEVAYSTREELVQILGSLPGEIELVENSIGQAGAKGQRIAKEGFDSAYRFVNGKVELLAHPLSAIEAVVLTLYAYYPDMAWDKDVRASTGIEDFRSKVVTQTKNREYFRIDGDRYGLSDEGLSYVQERIKPKVEHGAGSTRE
jgi:hypothetical protein